MRIVAVADTHTFQSELGVLPEGDAFVHAGDLLRAGELDELEPVAEWIRALPHRHKIVVAGNHDRCFEDSSTREAARRMLGSDVHYLEDGGVSIDGIRFWGSPWQPAYNDWAFNLGRGTPLAEKWALVPAGVDVLITHGPPQGIGDRGPVGGRQGCEALRAELARIRPRAHLFGHIHQDGGAWAIDATLFANVTTWECERAPTVIDIDASGASPISVPPRSMRPDYY